VKIGDYAGVQSIKNQSVARWVVLTDLIFDENGDAEGGTIAFIANTKSEAGDAAYEIDRGGKENLLLCGTLPEYELCVGGVFVK
jgi:hypothetical protein